MIFNCQKLNNWQKINYNYYHFALVYYYSKMQETLDNIRKIVKDNWWTFPYYIQLLKNAGVARYLVNMSNYNTTYYMYDWTTYTEEIYKSWVIWAKFDQSALIHTFHSYEKWDIDADTRLTQSRLAWVNTYEVNIWAMQISFYGNGGSYSESISTVTI